MLKIASGAYGNVFLRPTKMNIIKKPKNKNANFRGECAITRKIHKIVPQNVINIKGCSSKTIRMNYHRIGSLEGLFLKKSKLLTDTFMMRIVKKILAVLAKIHKVDPSFRHNDLHIGNILIDSKLNPIITDFGLASDKQYKNPLHTRYMKLTAGIYPNNNYMYDAHTFMNFVYSYIRMLKLTKQMPKTYKYLGFVLKGGYSGKTNTYVRDYRLKPGVSFKFKSPPVIRTRKSTTPSTDAWAKASFILKNIATIKKM